MLKVFRQKSYFLKLSKSRFLQKQIDFLGWIVEAGTIKPDPAKVQGLKEWPRELHSVAKVRSTIGVIRYQRPFIPNFSAIAKPILKLTKKDQPFEWTEECTKALNTLIEIITNDPILRPPDLERQFHLDIDASNYVIGGILYQLDDEGIRYDVGYYSKSLVAAERNYDIWDREYLALIRCLLHWRQFLVGSPHKVRVYTDHANLQYWREPQKIPDKIRRYIVTDV